MASIEWCMERMHESCARVQREAESKADRIIAQLSTFEEIPFHEQRKHFYDHGFWGPEIQPRSVYEHRRIIEPRERVRSRLLFEAIMADLDALVDAA